MDILKRALAPVTDEAWSLIEEQAKLSLQGLLSARTVTDFSGPHGLTKGAVDLGRIDFREQDGLLWGARHVQPLIEVRVPFSLSLDELDNVSRGAKDPNLDALQQAARRIAFFEENAVYNGHADGGIEGLIPSSPHDNLPLPREAAGYPEAVETAIVTIEEAGVGGPFDLVLGNEPFQIVMQGDGHGYPMKRRLEELIRGTIRWSGVLAGGLLISRRGGDYELTVGQDLGIGYQGHDGHAVWLFFTESFTFRVIEPAAAAELRAG